MTIDIVSLKAFSDELSKTALLERLVRLGATDIPKTPRMFMKQRSPQQLAGLQSGVENWWGKKVTQPILNTAEKGLQKLPQGKVQNALRHVAGAVAKDPIGVGLSSMAPVPGAELAYLAGKRGLERAIDRFAPLPAIA